MVVSSGPLYVFIGNNSDWESRVLRGRGRERKVQKVSGVGRGNLEQRTRFRDFSILEERDINCGLATQLPSKHHRSGVEVGTGSTYKACQKFF